MEAGRTSGDIEFACGDGRRRGYLAEPAAGRGPGVLVVHEGTGLVEHTRDVCDRLAREGFVALAPDLYRGRPASPAADALSLMEALDPAEAARDLDAAVTALFGRDAVVGARVGAVGFCMGGSLALLAGAGNRRVGAVADFYGAHPSIQPDVSGMQAAVLGIFAENDEFVSSESVERLRGDLDAAGVRSSIRTVPGVSHGFMNDTRPDVYDASASLAAWDTLLAFLRAELS